MFGRCLAAPHCHSGACAHLYVREPGIPICFALNMSRFPAAPGGVVEVLTAVASPPSSAPECQSIQAS